MSKRKAIYRKSYITKLDGTRTRPTWKQLKNKASLVPVPYKILTPIQKLYIMTIMRMNDDLGRFPYQQEIADKLGVSQQAVSNVLKVLVIRGWVIRVNKFRWTLAARLPRTYTLDMLIAELKDFTWQDYHKLLKAEIGATPRELAEIVFIPSPDTPHEIEADKKNN